MQRLKENREWWNEQDLNLGYRGNDWIQSQVVNVSSNDSCGVAGSGNRPRYPMSTFSLESSLNTLSRL